MLERINTKIQQKVALVEGKSPLKFTRFIQRVNSPLRYVAASVAIGGAAVGFHACDSEEPQAEVTYVDVKSTVIVVTPKVIPSATVVPEITATPTAVIPTIVGNETSKGKDGGEDSTESPNEKQTEVPAPAATSTPTRVEPTPTEVPPTPTKVTSTPTPTPTITPVMPTPTLTPTRIPTPIPTPTATEVPASKDFFNYLTAQEIFALANEYRASRGLPLLVLSSQLRTVAENFAKVQAVNRGTGHIGPDGSTLDQRVQAVAGNKYKYMSENISGDVKSDVGQLDSGAEYIAAFQSSPSHNDTLLEPSLTELGVGCYVSFQPIPGRVLQTCVMVFGTPW